LRTHSLSSNNNFSPIRRDAGNIKKFAQRVNFSEKYPCIGQKWSRENMK
jgi:hypothetical protein